MGSDHVVGVGALELCVRIRHVQQDDAIELAIPNFTVGIATLWNRPTPALISLQLYDRRFEVLLELTSEQAPVSTGTADVSQQRQDPLQAPGRPSPALTTRPTPLLEGAFHVAIRADPRASKPQELPVAVPKQVPVSKGTADVNQERQGPL